MERLFLVLEQHPEISQNKDHLFNRRLTAHGPLVTKKPVVCVNSQEPSATCLWDPLEPFPRSESSDLSSGLTSNSPDAM